MIHPTAVIHPNAQLDSTVVVGPFSVIDENVSLGPDCWVGPHVYLTGVSLIGAGNRFHAGCVIGDAPQDTKYKNEPTRLLIGDHNTFREHVTVHRSSKVETETVIGSHNLLMANSHVAHNCLLGSHVTLANGVLLGGHVTVDDRAFLSGNALVHQFVRIGTLVLMQGGAGVSKDLPPYTVARGRNRICGLNTIGLRRAGLPSSVRTELRKLYQLLFRSGQHLRESVEAARLEFSSETAQVLLNFIAASKRGVCPDIGRPARSEEEDGEEETGAV